jgi:hypothetical protein
MLGLSTEETLARAVRVMYTRPDDREQALGRLLEMALKDYQAVEFVNNQHPDNPGKTRVMHAAWVGQAAKLARLIVAEFGEAVR